MNKLSKEIPQEFFEFLRSHNEPKRWTESAIQECKEILSNCDPNATSDNVYQKYLLLTSIPLEIVKWLVERGADVNVKSTYDTPLMKHAYSREYEICKFLIENGADVNAECFAGMTALCRAADNCAAEVVRLLLENGADSSHHLHSVLEDGRTALLYVLSRHRLAGSGDVAELLVNDQKKHGGIPETEWKQAQKYVHEMGHQYELKKSNKKGEVDEDLERFKNDPELYNWLLNSRKETAIKEKESIEKLYEVFGVEPVKPIIKHDGKSPITIDETLSKEKQFSALWDYLVPAKGHAQTVQGELIRISGRLDDEINGNGGSNWDSQYEKMTRAIVRYLKNGSSLSKEELQDVKYICDGIIEDEGYNCDGLEELQDFILKWISQNPQPIILEKVGYRR